MQALCPNPARIDRAYSVEEAVHVVGNSLAPHRLRVRERLPRALASLSTAFSKSLPMELLRAREAVMRRFRPALRDHGVTEQQWRILRALAHFGALEAGALAEATCLLAPSLSRILPDMEAKQLISRRQLDSDLRRSVISLEPKAMRLIATHAPSSEKIYDEIASTFGEERLTQLFTLLQQLETCLAVEPGRRAIAARLKLKTREQMRHARPRRVAT